MSKRNISNVTVLCEGVLLTESHLTFGSIMLVNIYMEILDLTLGCHLTVNSTSFCGIDHKNAAIKTRKHRFVFHNIVNNDEKEIFLENHLFKHYFSALSCCVYNSLIRVCVVRHAF